MSPLIDGVDVVGQNWVGGQGVGKVGGWGCLSRFDGGGVSLGRGRGPRRDDEWCLVIPSSWEPAVMSSATTSALLRQPLAQVL